MVYQIASSHYYAAGPPPRPPTQQQNYGPAFEGANHRQQQPFFQYSQCTGKKKALCVSYFGRSARNVHVFLPIYQIGINYFGTQSELKGCINDAQNVRNFLCSKRILVMHRGNADIM